MVRSVPPLVGMAILVAVTASGCGEAKRPAMATEPPTTNGPVALLAVLSAEEAQGATVGSAFTYDVAAGRLRFSDPRGGGLAYRLAVSPTAAGLMIDGTRVVGVPTTVGIITVIITATDIAGNTAESRFPVIAQSADLSAPVLPETPYAYGDEHAPIPPAIANSPQVVRIDNMTPANRVTDAGATLGRVLFYDRRLSVNDRISCSSCHQQQFSFSDTARLSIGVLGTRTRRHSMALTNVRFYGPSRFFRDERAATLEELALQPVFDATEMGLPPDVLVPKLKLAGYYAPLFTAAFGDSVITHERTARALSQFVRSLRTSSSKIDSMLAGTAVLTPQEQSGLFLFEGAGCKSCHESYAVVSDAARNNGLDGTNVDVGAGAGRLKAPSLRNVLLRPPYMHDGRFRTIEEVIDFYDSGVQDNRDLDQRMRNHDGTPRRLLLTSDQKLSLIAFLGMLTDRAFLTDPRFSNPFPR